MVFESLGRSLYDYIKMNNYKPFPYTYVKAWTQQLIEAVQFLHDRLDLCHTDLKPENVLSLTISNEYQMKNDAGDEVTVPEKAFIKGALSPRFKT
jgi:thiamine kinase-like enzyme